MLCARTRAGCAMPRRWSNSVWERGRVLAVAAAEHCALLGSVLYHPGRVGPHKVALPLAGEMNILIDFKFMRRLSRK